jgi:hypothetical protein
VMFFATDRYDASSPETLNAETATESEH